MNPLDLLVLLAAAATVVLFWLGGRSYGGWLAVLLYAAQLGLLLRIGQDLTAGESVTAGVGATVLSTHLTWSLSGLGWFFAVITVGAALFCAWFSIGEWGRAWQRLRTFHGLLALNVLAMLVLLCSADLLSLFIGWELVSWATFGIMVQAGGVALRASVRYIMYSLAGAMAVLAGLVLLHNHAGSLDLVAAVAVLPKLSSGQLWLLFVLFTAGFGVKMALMPFHLWQAEAYAESPGPAAAFLGAISSRMGLFAMLVLLVQVIGLERLGRLVLPFTFLDARTVLAWIAAVTLVIPTFIALRQNDARKLLAWHGIGQGGFMLLGIAVATPMGVAGGLMHVLNHATYQAALFLSVTAVVHRTGTADLDRLGGLINRMPLSYVTMLFGIIGLAGLPPMNGFVSKWLIYKALLDTHMPLLLLAAFIGTLGTILSVYKLIHNTFLGQLRREHEAVSEVPWTMTVPMLALAAIAFITGFLPGLALDGVSLAQRALGIPVLAHHLGGVEWPTGSLNMLWVVPLMFFGMGVAALVFYGMGNRDFKVHQLDNYAGGHFLTADVRYHYSHNFYPGLIRVIGPWYRGSIEWVEGAIVSVVRVVSSAMHGFYQTGRTQMALYLLAGTVLLLAFAR